tara:strand:- start:83 stop:928 length:846 start_codon:yes stop_codon:yes gene_type:complete
MARKIGIIGANGFVGKNLKKELEMHGHIISRISIRSKKLRINDNLISNDSRNKIGQEMDMIIDCSTPISTNEKQADYLKEAKDFIEIINSINFQGDYALFSSVSVYSDKENRIEAETNLKPWEDYGKSKLLKEIELKKIIKSNNKNANFHILRASGILGRDMPNTFIKRITDNAIRNKEIYIYSSDALFNCIIHIDQIIDITKKLINENESKILILGSKDPITLKELASTIKDYTASESKLIEKKMGREPFTINTDTLNEYKSLILSTKDTILNFLQNYTS